MGEGRLGPAQGFEDQRLARGVAQVVVAADDVGDAHVVVVDDHGKVVGRRAVRAEQDQVVQLLVHEPHRPLDHVVDDGLAFDRPLETDHEGAAVIVCIALAPGRADGAALGPRLGPLGLHLLHRHVAAVGAAGGEQLVDHGAVAVSVGVLENRRRVRLQVQPVEPVQDHLHRAGGRTLAICVFDAQEERSRRDGAHRAS